MKLLIPLLIFGTVYSEERKLTVEEKIEKVTQTELPLPDFLCNNSQTPSDYMDGMTSNKESITKLGIQIDNYSGYTLKNPIFHPYKEDPKKAWKFTSATKLGEALPHRTEFMVLKNSHKRYGIWGSFSWEIFSGEKHTRQRMVVTFGIPYNK